MKTIFTSRAQRAASANGPLTRREVIGAPAQTQRGPAEPRPSEVAVATDGAKMSVVIVDDLTALEKHIAAWEELAAAAIEPNVFYEPWMLMPALRAYGDAGRLLFALVQTPDPARPLGPPLLCGFFPLELKDHYDGISSRLPIKTLRLWRKPEMIYLCAPLLRVGCGREALAAFFDWLSAGDHDCSLMEFGFVTGEGPFHHLLLDYLNQHLKFTYVTEAFTRALFRPAADAEDYVRSALGRFRRKEIRRLEKRLAETGRLEYATLDPCVGGARSAGGVGGAEGAGGDDVDTWIEEFLEFEAMSWKGKGGRALVCSETDRKYFMEIAREAFRRGKLMMLALHFNGHPIAYKVNFLSGDGSFAFKIAFDEEYARYSPGVLLELENIRLLHERTQIRWMDSCANPDRFMINHLWTDRRAIQSLVISTGKRQGDLIVAAIPLLKWGNRRIFRRDLLGR
ncbi:MAG TPA: GNAT family N-acetyltransferase [Blastocatellia bacterium]